MNVYTAEFDGIYPVGANLICIAENEKEALEMINKELESLGFQPITKEDIKFQDTSSKRVEILLDGDY